MKQEEALIKENKAITGKYYLLSLIAKKIANKAGPGQFVHIGITNSYFLTLRRPFSIFDVNKDTISILYKVVGRGTEMMSSLKRGDKLDVIGPLGNGFPVIKKDVFPVLIAGGYGAAALHLLAKRAVVRGVLFIGAANVNDLLCLKDFARLKWRIIAATEDGSYGEKGLVTDILQRWLMSGANEILPKKRIEFFACGPSGMLKALGQIAEERNIQAWLSLDRHMGCGIGVCLACVQKIKDKEQGTTTPHWRWARVCKEGPVFNSKDVEWN